MHPVLKYLACLSLMTFIELSLLFGGTSPKSVVASATTSAPRIDGHLNDECWQLAVPVEGFLQSDPEEGEQPTERTSVSVLYDDNALYVGVHCYDSHPDEIVRQMSRRDRTLQSDRVSVIIDSYHDHSTAFLFSGSVSGVQSDGVLSQDGRVYDIQWDAVWEFNASIESDGWVAEFRIPFSALRFSDQDSEYVWGINFRRFIARKQETDEWVMAPRKEVPVGTISSVSKMGHLTGLRNIHPPLHLELMPYQVSQENYLSQPDPFPLHQEFKASGGLDLKYGVTNNFTFDMAINPDFGQVEVDQAVLNLTVFKTFYPEKRPFFLEGAQLFSFGHMFDNRQLYLFYSRTIGRTPPQPAADAGYTFVETPQTARILAAAKLTGRTDNGLTIAALSAATDREDGIEENLSGDRQTIPFVSRDSYNILRVKQDVLENSSIGAMATSSFAQDRSPILSGGVDWNLRFEQGTYALDGYLAGSEMHTSIDENLSGGAGRIGFAKVGGEHWLYFTLYDFSARNFSLDELGFYSQPREHGGYTQLSYKEDYAEAPVRRYAYSAQTDYRWNWDGAKTVSQVEFEPTWQFRNFWTLDIDYIRHLPAYDDANRGIVGLYRRPAGDQVTLTLQTDSRNPVVLNLIGGYQNSTKNLSTVYSTLLFTLKPNTWIEFDPAVTLLRTRNEEAWPLYYYTADGNNLFADRDIDQFDFSLRGTMTFTRTVSVQFFTQLFLAKGEYTHYKELIGGDDLVPYAYNVSLGNPDFNEKIINANVVFRWEYLPGSTFYFVWTQARYGDNGMYAKSFGDNIADAFRLPMDNVILGKITYWWSL